MSSMIEQVKEAEILAAKIRSDAQTALREKLAAAQAEVKERKAKVAEEERAELRDALKKAETDGEALKDDIISKRKSESDEFSLQAVSKISDGVAYLLGKVVSGI